MAGTNLALVPDRFTGVPRRSEDEFGDEEGASYLPVSKLRRQYLDYVGGKAQEIEEQKEGRRYRHGAHWTAEDVRLLRARRQPIITYNRIGRKLSGIAGLVERMRQDPKAYPRTPQHEQGAEIATSSVRYVCESSDWKTLSFNETLRAATEGIAGVELRLIEGDQGDPDVELHGVEGGDFFYDPRSIKIDFSDARYHGIAKWVDLDEAISLFPDHEDELRGLIESGSDLTINADNEFKWLHVSDQRLRLVEHWYKHRNKWYWAFYISFYLIEQGKSPFLNEKNKSTYRYHMWSAAVDQDGDRYGFPRNFKGPQDEINQRRSKGLHISNMRRIIVEKGAVDDIETTRREMVRPDGVIEVNPGKKLEFDDASKQGDLKSQFDWLEEAKNEMESFANVNVISQMGGQGVGNLSGIAINMLQQPGFAELGEFIMARRAWRLRVYRAVWCAIRQFWTSERWIRVTDDKDAAGEAVSFLQLNGLEMNQQGQPTLINALGVIDVDFNLDEGPEVLNMEQDTWAAVKDDPNVPPAAKIMLSPIQGSKKKLILQMMAPPQDPMAPMKAQLEIRGAVAAVKQIEAEAEKDAASAVTQRASAINQAAQAAEHASKAQLNAAQTYQVASTAMAEELARIAGFLPPGQGQQGRMTPQAPQPMPQPMPQPAPQPPAFPQG